MEIDKIFASGSSFNCLIQLVAKRFIFSSKEQNYEHVYR